METGAGRWTETRFGGVIAAAVAVVVGLALAGTPAPASAQDAAVRQIDETRAVDAGASVEVDVVVREVRVTGWDRSEVRVQGSMNPEYEEFSFERDEDGTITIELELRDDAERDHREDRPDFGPLTVSVPRGASVEVEVVNGPLTVQDVSGAVSLETVNGSITYSGASTSVEAEAVNGTVDVRAPRSNETRAGSVNGDVIVRVAGGVVEAETVSGDIDVRTDVPVEAVDAETVSGGIEFRGAPASSASLSFESHSGDVVVHLPSGLNAVLEAETFSGNIESAFGGEVQRDGEYTPERSYRHTVGSGGTRVSAETFSGSVSFRRQGG